MTDKELVRYFCRIKRNIVGSRKEKRVFLQDLQENIEDYREQYPDATLSDIQERFGSPEHIGREYIIALDEDVLCGRIMRVNRKKAIVIGWIAAAVAALLVLGLYCVIDTVAHIDREVPITDVTITYTDGDDTVVIDQYP